MFSEHLAINLSWIFNLSVYIKVREREMPDKREGEKKNDGQKREGERKMTDKREREREK